VELTKRRIIIIVLIALLLFSFLTVVFLDEVNFEAPNTAQVVWQKNYGGSEDDRAFYALTNDQGYLVVGSTRSVVENTTMGWAVQFDLEGNTVWNRTYMKGTGTELRYVLNLTDGYLLVGNEYVEGNFANGLVIETDREGNEIWSRTIDSNDFDKIFSAIQVPDGFMLLGATSIDDGHSVGWAVRMDPQGEVLWSKEYLRGAESTIRQGVLAPDGSLICVGYAKVEDYQFLALKIDSSGELVWNQTYGQESSQKAYSIAKAADGFIVVGDKVSLQSDSDAWVIKVGWNGTLLWEKTVGGKDADSASVVSDSVDGNYLVTGFTFSYGKGNRDVWVFKISDQGNVIWSCTIGDSGYQEAYQVLDVGKNKYVVVGWSDPKDKPALIGKAQYDFYIAKLGP
jgi:hypothetical protein